jgi:hypothetical protein
MSERKPMDSAALSEDLRGVEQRFLEFRGRL